MYSNKRELVGGDRELVDLARMFVVISGVALALGTGLAVTNTAPYRASREISG
jgi:hypothetical protein